jgi:hypothetical protein
MLSAGQKLLDRENNILSAIMFIAIAMFIFTLGLRNDSCIQESFPSGKSVIKNAKMVNATGKHGVDVASAECTDSALLPGDISHFCQKKVLHSFASVLSTNRYIVNSAHYTSEIKALYCSCRYVVSKTSVVLLI